SQNLCEELMRQRSLDLLGRSRGFYSILAVLVGILCLTQVYLHAQEGDPKYAGDPIIVKVEASGNELQTFSKVQVFGVDKDGKATFLIASHGSARQIEIPTFGQKASDDEIKNQQSIDGNELMKARGINNSA